MRNCIFAPISETYQSKRERRQRMLEALPYDLREHVLLPLMAAPLFLSFMSSEMSQLIEDYVLNNDLVAIGRAASLAVAFTLAAATLVLFWFAKRRFKRNQLILD